MATNLARLRKPASKGAPPAPETAADVIATDPRPDAAAERQRPLQVRVPESVFAEFSERAGREFGYTHGGKKQLFLKMWQAYKAQGME
jgi:hypothetical protein